MDAIKTKIVHLEPKKHGVVGDRKLVIRVIYEDIIAEQGRKEPS